MFILFLNLIMAESQYSSSQNLYSSKQFSGNEDNLLAKARANIAARGERITTRVLEKEMITLQDLSPLDFSRKNTAVNNQQSRSSVNNSTPIPSFNNSNSDFDDIRKFQGIGNSSLVSVNQISSNSVVNNQQVRSSSFGNSINQDFSDLGKKNSLGPEKLSSSNLSGDVVGIPDFSGQARQNIKSFGLKETPKLLDAEKKFLENAYNKTNNKQTFLNNINNDPNQIKAFQLPGARQGNFLNRKPVYENSFSPAFIRQQQILNFPNNSSFLEKGQTYIETFNNKVENKKSEPMRNSVVNLTERNADNHSGDFDNFVSNSNPTIKTNATREGIQYVKPPQIVQPLLPSRVTPKKFRFWRR